MKNLFLTKTRWLVTIILLTALGIGNAWGASTTVSWSAGSYSSSTITWSATDICSIFQEQNGAQSAPSSSYVSAPRWYSGNKITITAGSGVSTFTSIVITATSNAYGNTLANSTYTVTGGTGSISASNNNGTVTISLTGTVTAFTIVMGGQSRLGAPNPTINYTAAAAGPAITVSTTSLTEVGYSTTDFSQQVKSFKVSGSNLKADVTVTAPTNYEVCKTAGGSYAASVSFSKGSGTLSASDVYVRLKSGKTAGNYSGDISCTSTEATTKTVSLSGSVPYTITWSANESTFATTYVAVGGTLTLPGSTPNPATYSCTGKYFYGWYGAGSSYSSESVAPSIAANGNAVSADKTYYAVFADRSGSGDVTWDKVTSAPSDWSGDYIITNAGGSNAMISDFYSGTSGEFKSSSVTISNNKVTSTPTDKMIWTIAKNGATSQYSLKNKSTGTYANITGTSSTNAALNASAVWFTISCSSGTCIINSVTYSTRAFAWYSSRNSFRTYANTGNTYCNMYKKSGDGYTWSNYATSCSSTAKTITIVPVAGGTVTTSPSGSAEAGNTVTITLTPDAHYTVGGAPTVVDANSQSVAVSGSGTSYTFTMPNANVTITPATWNPINVTITWHRKTGNTPQVVQEGKSDLTFPNTTDVDADCAPFLGWIEGTSWTDSQDEPATYYEVGDLVPAVNTNIDYTAIYGERETTETAAYVKVTSAPVDWSGDYLIVREIGGEYYVAFDGSLTTLDVNNNYVNVSASGGAIAATNALAAKKWTIAKIGATSDYSIKSASGYYIGCTGTGNGLNSSTSTVYSNTLSYSTDHTVITSSGGPVLQTYNSSRFRYYASSQGAIQLYKLGTAEMETVTYTKNPACTPKYRITVNSVTGGSPSSDKSLEPAGETITLTANTADGYSFAGWTLTHTEGGAAASVTYTTGSASTETAAFTMPAYDVTVTASFAKKVVSELKVMDGSTVVANTTGSVSGTLNVSTGTNKTLDVVITPADAFDHSWTASVTAGGTYASISNVTSDGFRVNGLSQGDATVTVTAPNDGSAKVVTFTVHVTDVLPSEIILKRDGSETPIDALTMYYDAANSRGQYVKVNVSYSPTPTNKGFTFSSADATFVSSHAHAQTNPNFYETLNARKVTSSPVNCTFTSAATGSVTKVLAVTVLPCPADQFVDYIHGNATVTRAAQVSADHWSINTSITTPTLSDSPESSSADCEAGHYHLIGWLPQSIAEALFEAGTPITSETEGLVTAGAEVEASGITWYAIWAKKE